MDQWAERGQSVNLGTIYQVIQNSAGLRQLGKMRES